MDFGKRKRPGKRHGEDRGKKGEREELGQPW
jgi:hypothetical protein